MTTYDWNDKEIIKMFNADYNLKDIANELNYPYQPLRYHTNKVLGLRKFKHVSWTKSMIDDLHTYTNYGGKEFIANKYGIPISAIYKKAESLGIKFTPSHKKMSTQGYVEILVEGNTSYALEHRYVMEQSLGRPLKTYEIVHHIDGNKLNNILANLKLTTRSEHISIHREDLYKRRYSLVPYESKW